MFGKLLQVVSNHTGFLGCFFFVSVSYWGVSRSNRRQKAAKAILDKALKTNTAEPLTLHPEIDASKCAGCGACTRVCPEGDILKLINNKAVLVSPTKCVGHGECESACPFGAINLVFGTKTRGLDIPRLTSNYETNVPGLYIAGELGGMGLIRNAVKQGALAALNALEKIDRSTQAEYDLLVVGAGPGGLAASLAAIASKASHLCIEQNTFGGAVANFPRQKIVMSHPADLPVVGKMKFLKNKVSKEELLEYWSLVRKKTGIKISEQEKFETLSFKDGVFHVKTSKGLRTSRKVILAMGVRGSPRRLGLPNEDLPKVTYNLIDPEQYKDADVAVIGGGNAGVEAAQYLGKKLLKCKVTLLIHGATLDRCNEENRGIIEAMQKQGLVDIWYNSHVKEIHADHLVISKQEQLTDLKNKYLFVFIGAEMPQAFLMSLGIHIDKKFGESLSKTAS